MRKKSGTGGSNLPDFRLYYKLQSSRKEDTGTKKERQKKTKEKAEAFATAMKNVLKQPEKNAQRDPGEKGWACYYCGKEGHMEIKTKVNK